MCTAFGEQDRQCRNRAAGRSSQCAIHFPGNLTLPCHSYLVAGIHFSKSSDKVAVSINALPQLRLSSPSHLCRIGRPFCRSSCGGSRMSTRLWLHRSFQSPGNSPS